KANIYPVREFLARGKQESQIISCPHCQAENGSCAHIIGYCLAVQDARIKRHNHLCELLAEAAKKKDWVVFQELLLTSEQDELYKLDLVFVKRDQALVVNITVRYESKLMSLADAVVEKVKKYQHLKDQAQELTEVNIIKFMGFQLGTCGKWYQGNYELLKEVRLSSSWQEELA
ncbi:hypothetical protein N336_12206, partial [Phalacrocorax carbo]